MTNLLPGRNNFYVSTQEPFHQGQNGALYRTTLNNAKRPNSGTIWTRVAKWTFWWPMDPNMEGHFHPETHKMTQKTPFQPS